MKQYTNGYVSNRVLKLNVGFVLSAGPSYAHETSFDVPPVRVSDDVDLSYIRGDLRLSRTKEGVLVQGELHVGLEGECYRCLDPIAQDLTITIEELYTYPASVAGEFSIGEDAILDLAPLVRAEALIADTWGGLCKPDCKGLCPECGANLNHESNHAHEAEIDPRMAKLKQLLDR